MDLRCEYLKNPLGIDRTTPRLSWKLQAAPLAGRGLRQTAFQIQVAATEEALGGGKADLWDSGKVKSDRSNLVAYMGKALESRQMCWWKVRSLGPGWQGFGVERTRPLEHGIASGERLGSPVDRLERRRRRRCPTTSGAHALPARMLRREFDASKPIRRAMVYATGLGFFDLYLNGARVGDHIMDPALTEYSKLILYVTFDVTRQLQPGKNALGVVLGNGRFFAPQGGQRASGKLSRLMATRGCCCNSKSNTPMARASEW